jgi:hypothetical protein
MAAVTGAALSLISQPELFGDDTFATQLREAVIASITVSKEDRLIGEAIGAPPVGYCALDLAAWRGEEAAAVELIETTTRLAAAHGLGRLRSLADHASAVLHNGLGRHAAARDAARRAFQRDEVGYDTFIGAELAEAASRTGDRVLVTAVLDRLSKRARAVPPVVRRMVAPRAQTYRCPPTPAAGGSGYERNSSRVSLVGR